MRPTIERVWLCYLVVIAVVAALDEPGVYCQLDYPASWSQAFAPAFEDIGTVFSLPR